MAIPKRIIPKPMPKRIAIQKVEPARLRPPYEVRAKLPDGRRYRIGGNGWSSCMLKAAGMGALYIIDEAKHKWMRTPDGNYESASIIKTHRAREG